jgi:hypothetical protein
MKIGDNLSFPLHKAGWIMRNENTLDYAPSASLVSKPQVPTKIIFAHRWFTHIWTLLEGFLAKKK